MPDLDFLIHLPLLKIEQDRLPFAGALLYRMPFSRYDKITQGAFSEQRASYEATEPVFLAFSVAIPEEGLERRANEAKGVKEIKLPSNRAARLDDLGLGPLNWALSKVADRAWSALLLVAPAAALPSPRWSQSFISIDGGFTLSTANGPATAARVQGQSDHEYLFFPEAPSGPIPAADIARAAELVPSVRGLEQVEELRGALIALQATSLPTLSRQDRMTIAVQGLESLLMPEVTVQLKRTLVRRSVALLASDAPSVEAITAFVRELYDLRSESVHGAAVSNAGALIEGALAEQLLAAAILKVSERVAAGQTVAAIRVEIDGNGAAAKVSRPAQAARLGTTPTGRASNHRLARPQPSSDVFSITSSMVAKDGHVCCWSPLLGLTTEGLEDPAAMLLGEPPVPILMPLSPKALWDLEERDVRRDFLAEFVRHGHPMAVLMTIPEHDEPAAAEQTTPWMERMRDLGVVTLRLAGYDEFLDPELFGSAVFEGARRLRRPTVLRQTVAEQIRHEATQHIGRADTVRLTPLWRELWRYQSAGPTPAIEHVFSLFRRSFDRDFLDPAQRALILVSLLEGMLGRFRGPKDAFQLEDFVASLVGQTAETDWFRADGRAFRNRVAHARGAFSADDSGEPIKHLSLIVSHLVRELICTWNEAGEGERRKGPSALLIVRATARLEGVG